MQVTLKRVDNAFKFEAAGSSGVPAYIDASNAIGGQNKGVRPMEMLLMGLGGCSAFDLVEILRKQRQTLSGLEIVINGKRREKIPAVFETIHVHYRLTGELDEKKTDRAISLSLKKYCSAYEMLSKTANIDYSFDIEKME